MVKKEAKVQVFRAAIFIIRRTSTKEMEKMSTLFVPVFTQMEEM